MKSFLLMSEKEMVDTLGLEKPFQARIIRKGLLSGASSFQDLTSLPKSLRDRLGKEYPSALLTKVLRTDESPSAVKLAIGLEDGSVVECVRLSDGVGRHTACLSSQVGCAMGCSFCRTGTMGLVRNLSASEIVEQYVHLARLGEPVSHIVFMGMGEALQNFEALMDTLQELHREDGYNISFRRMTISTSGYVPGINRLSELPMPVRLAVSLVSADDETRSRIMRVNQAYPLPELKKALMSYQHRNDRRITLECCLLHGINTDRESAEKLYRFARGLDTVINLIPWNPVPGMEYETPGAHEVERFADECRRLGLNVTFRKEKGRSINSACGQLATEVRKRG